MRLFIIFYFFLFSIRVDSQKAALDSDIRSKPEIHWKFSISQIFMASPVVVDNAIYVGGMDSVLHAINLFSGREIWKFKTRGPIRSNVCIHENKVYLNGGDGKLYCLNAKNGGKIWEFSTLGEQQYDFADYFHSSPIVHENVLYFGSGDKNFYALNSQTGSKIWDYKTSGIIHTTPVAENNKIFFGSFDGYVYALNGKSGQLVWKFKTVGQRYFPLGEVQGSPVAFDGKIFIGARDYNVYAIDQEKGYCHWNKAFKDGWGLSTTIHKGVLYIGCADERKLIAVNPKTGAEYWNKKMEFLIFGNPAFSDSMLYVGTTIGKLHGMNLQTGEKLWSFETESYVKNKLKYFKEDDSYRDDIYSIIKSNEHFLEVEYELGGIFSSPVFTNNMIVFSSTNGTLYCLKKSSSNP